MRDPRGARDPGQVPGEGGEVGGADHEAVVLDRHAGHRRAGHDRGRQRAVVGRPQPERVGPVGHEAADLPEVAGRREPPGDHDEDALGDPLHLLQDVGGEEDRPALAGQVAEQVHHVEALARIHPVEGLVEDQDGRVVDEGRGHLGALAHPLRVGRERAVGGARQLDRREGPLDRVGGAPGCPAGRR